MKTRIVILLGCILLLNSCILKSIKPFYVTEAITYKKDFLGKWKDSQNGTWEMRSFKTFYESEFKNAEKPTKKDERIYHQYQKAYIVEHEKKGKKAIFMAMLFTINDKLFVDFTPFHVGLENENELLGQHLISTHSIAKIERLTNKKFTMKWLDESKIDALLREEKIQIQHEKMGVDDDIILTATSKELYKFLEKFEATNEDEIWGTSDQITLESIHAKP